MEKPATARPFATVVFDFDGTLADTFQKALEIVNALAAEFQYRPVAPEEVDDYKGLPYQKIMRKLGIPVLKAPVIMNRARVELYRDIAAVRPIPGMRAALEGLRARGLALGVLTSNSQENVERFLDAHGLGLFDWIYCGSKIWGKAKRMRDMARERGLDPAATLYVGDETRDVEAAREFGARVVSVTWGYNTRAALEAMGPDFIIDDPAQLLDIAAPGGAG